MIIIIIIVVIVGYFVLKSLFKNPADNYVLEKIDRGEVLQEISETGNLEATDNINLGFKTLGRIESISVSVGEDVKKGQVLASLDVNQLSQQLKNYQAALEVAEAQYQKLLNGYTPEDIKVYEDARNSAKQDLDNAYSSAITTLNDAYTKAYNALNVVDDIFTTYFSLIDQQGIKVDESRTEIKDSVNDIKNYFDSAKNSSSQSNIDLSISQTIKLLGNISSSMKTVIDMVYDGKYYFTVSSADKTSLETQKGYIDTAFTGTTTSQQNISSYEIALEKAESNLVLRKAEPRQEDIDVYAAQVKQAEANVSLYQSQMYDASLRAPIDGKITKVNNKPGEIVSANQAVVNLLSSNPFQIKVNIYEQDVVNIKVGNPVKVTLIAFPKDPLIGKVVSIDPAEKIVDQVVYYETTIDFPNDLEGIRSGMTADIVIETDKKEDVIRIPSNLVVGIDGKEMVQVFSNGKVEDREIVTGLEGNDYCEVVSGLSEGDVVVAGEK